MKPSEVKAACMKAGLPEGAAIRVANAVVEFDSDEIRHLAVAYLIRAWRNDHGPGGGERKAS